MVLGITGATGLVGSHLARLALAQGFEVRILSRNGAPGLESLGAQDCRGDLASPSSLRSFSEGCDAVVHSAAACSSTRQGSLTARMYWEANLEGTRQMIGACEELKIRRLVHVSTPSVLVDGTHQNLVAEDHAPTKKPIGLYAQTKLAAEELVKASDLEWTIVRPKAVFGVGDRTLLPGVIDALCRNRLMRIGRDPVMVGLTPAESVANALLLAATQPAVGGKVYHIDNGESMDLWALIDRIKRALNPNAGPLRRISYESAMRLARMVDGLAAFRGGRIDTNQYKVAILGRSQTLDISLARRELGFEPVLTVEDALVNTIHRTLGDEVAKRF